MTLLVRAIVRAADAPRSAWPELVIVRAEGLAALATACPEPPAATESELRAHDAITRRIHDGAPSLPSRFGQLFADEDALVRALRERGQSLAQSLDRVGDRVELAVTLRWRAAREVPDASEATSGTRYLEARAARERERREAEQVVARLIEQLPCERAFIRHSVCPRVGVAAIVALLSAREEVVALRRSVESFGERSSEISAEVHGPFAPYSFAS